MRPQQTAPSRVARFTRTARRGPAALGLALVALVSLGSLAPAGAAPTDDDAAPGQRLPTRGPVEQSPASTELRKLDVVGGLLRGTPIIDGDFADPYALSEDRYVYVYATNTTSANIPVMRMGRNALGSAEYLGDALPKLPSWTSSGRQWAPSVWAAPDGTFVMYYSTPSGGAGSRMCISRATAKDPAGPFTDDSSSAFICPLDKGGAIDPSVFVESDGSLHLVYKTDGNCCSMPTTIRSQKLSSDGLSLDGPHTELISDTQDWEAGVVEGPSMIRQGSRHFLFYSANNWNSDDYAIGVATCRSVTGPCTKTIDRPWMDSTRWSKGPGGEEFFESAGAAGIWMVHHGWLPGQAGTPDGQRRLYLDRISLHPDSLPTRSGTEAVEEALLEDAAVLALIGGLVVGGAVVGVGALRRRAKHARA